jgi:hypothetical protein
MTLLGKHIVIEVSEPWDFAGPDGSIRIAARIVEVGHGNMVAEAGTEIHVPGKNVRGTRLDIRPRYVGGRLRDIALGKLLTVGIAIIPSGKPIQAGIYAMIGTVCLAGCEDGPIA